MLNNNSNVSAPHGNEQTIKTELLAMLQSGENPFDIIYHLAEYLETASSEPGYAKIVLDTLRTIYGHIFLESKLLENELHEIEDRCQRIESALKTETFSEEEKARITLAINLHRQNAERLKSKIKLAEQKANSVRN